MKNFKASAFYRLGASSETGTSFKLQFHNLNFYTRNFRITNIKVIYITSLDNVVVPFQICLWQSFQDVVETLSVPDISLRPFLCFSVY